MTILKAFSFQASVITAVLIFGLVLPNQKVKADYPPFCQVKLISQPLICSSSGQAKYKVFFQNLVPKKLFWTNPKGGNKQEELAENVKVEESNPNFLSLIEPGDVVFTTQNNNKESIIGGSFWTTKPESQKEQADFFVIKLGQKGEIIWTQAMGSSDKNELMRAEANTTDGGMVLAGESEKDSEKNSWLLMKYDQKGVLVWSKKTEFEASKVAVRSIKQVIDGGFIVAGFEKEADRNLILVKYDENGEIVWSKKIPVSVKNSCQIEQLEDGSLVVIGDKQIADSKNSVASFMIRLDKAGQVLWSKQWENKGKISILNSIGKTADGNFVVAGETDNFSSNMDVILAKYSSGGEVIWSKRIDNQEGEKAVAIKQDPDKNFVFIGESFGPNKKDGFIIKFDENGKSIWAEKETGRNLNQFKSLDFNVKGEIIVGSNQVFTDKINFFKLDQNGEILGCEKLKSMMAGERKVDLTIQNFDLSVENVQAKIQKEELTTSTPAFSAQNICEYSFSNELTKEFNYTNQGIYNQGLLVENPQGEKIECQSLSQVELMSGGKCQIKLFYEDGESLASKMDWQKGAVIFNIFAGQQIMAKPELKCAEASSVEWKVDNGEVLSADNELLKAKFFVGGLAKIGATIRKEADSLSDGGLTCEEVNLLVKEKMRYGF